MLPRRIASRYASALFQLSVEKGTTAQWEGELAAVGKVIATMPELSTMLAHPEISQRQKQAVLQRAFGESVAREVLSLLFLLLRRGHEPDLNLIHEVFVERWNATRRVVPVNVISAVPLSEAQAAALTAALTKHTGAEVRLGRSVDPGLIAGMQITIGDRVIDASTRGTLEAMRASLAHA